MSVASALIAELSDRDLDRLAELLAPRIADRLPAAPVWLNTKQAAAYLACPVGRIYDLVRLGELSPRRDGRRLLFRRDELDG